MIFGEDHRFRNLIVVVIVLGGTLFASLSYANKLPQFLNFSFLKSQVTSTFTPSGTTTPAVTTTTSGPKLIDQILSVLANHQAATNNYQAVERSQATRSLLDTFMNQL